MKNEILAVLASIENLHLLETTKDYYWHHFEGSLGDFMTSIHVCPKTSRSIKVAAKLQREIIIKLKENKKKVVSFNDLATPRKKSGVLRLGAFAVWSVVGTEFSEVKAVINDPEITSLKSETHHSFTEGIAMWREERKLIRAIIIIVYPYPELYSTKKVELSSYEDLERLEILLK